MAFQLFSVYLRMLTWFWWLYSPACNGICITYTFYAGELVLSLRNYQYTWTPGIHFARYFTICWLFFCHISCIPHPFICWAQKPAHKFCIGVRVDPKPINFERQCRHGFHCLLT